MWCKSSYSAMGDCLEVWRKSQRSISNGECVEVTNGIRIRDSKNPGNGYITASPKAWQALLDSIKT